MAATCYTCDEELLKPGMPCIIEIDLANSPSGTWWGEVTAPGEAKITGGRVAFTENGHVVRSEEANGQTPFLNYHIYAPTEPVMHLLKQLHRAKEQAATAHNQTRFWKSANDQLVEAGTKAALKHGLEMATDAKPKS